MVRFHPNEEFVAPSIVSKTVLMILPIAEKLARQLRRPLKISIETHAGPLVDGTSVVVANCRPKDAHSQPLVASGQMRFASVVVGFLKERQMRFSFECYLDDGPIEDTGFSGFDVRGTLTPTERVENWVVVYNLRNEWRGWRGPVHG